MRRNVHSIKLRRNLNLLLKKKTKLYQKIEKKSVAIIENVQLNLDSERDQQMSIILIIYMMLQLNSSLYESKIMKHIQLQQSNI